MKTGVILFEYPAYGIYVDPATGSAVFWDSPRTRIYYLPDRPFSHPLLIQEFDPDMPYDTLLSELHPSRGQYPFPPYSLNMAEPIPQSPIIDIPEYPPWFNPEEDQVVLDVPMPDAPSPSPVAEPGFDGPGVPESSGSTPSTEFSSEVWIDQMMADLYSSSFETGEEDSTEDASSNNITGASE
ncbi:hypothetical protein S83_070043 [Arachis hypogaea]